MNAQEQLEELIYQALIKLHEEQMERWELMDDEGEPK